MYPGLTFSQTIIKGIIHHSVTHETVPAVSVVVKGKPDGVPAGTARDVERTARLEVSDLVDEKAVRLGPEEQTPLAVLTVPVLALHACIVVTE